MNSFGSFWIYDPVAQHVITAMHLWAGKKPDAALGKLKRRQLPTLLMPHQE
jgi:hypothetical protein